MKMDFFSSTDYYFSKFTVLNYCIWFLGIFWILLLVSSYYWGLSRKNLLGVSLTKWHLDNSSSKMIWQVKGSYNILVGSFIIMLGSNLWGLVPYAFGVTTQMVVTLIMGLMVWMMSFFSSFIYSPLSFFAHLTPLGSPMLLVSSLNVMELISQLMRPFTLALRLGMKMTTGHVFISLMGTGGSLLVFNSFFLFCLVCFMLWGYFLFEFGICGIQAFVFSLLKVQYLDEHSTS